MIYSDPSGKDGVIQEMDRICGSTDNTYPIRDKTSRVNQAIDRFYTLVFENDSIWHFDDANYTDLPIAVTNIVFSQADYSFAAELLTVRNVYLSDSSGNFTEIQNFSEEEWKAQNIFINPPGNSGIASGYVLMGNSVLLVPIPNYNYNGGLKVVFERNGSKFVYTDTTKTPGIPSLFHPYLARQASMPFLIEKNLPQLAGVMDQIAIDEDAIGNFLSRRNKASKTKITPQFRSSR